MANEPIKLSEPEIVSIQNIQAKYNQKISDLGKTEINLMSIESAAAALEQQRQKINNDLVTITNVKASLRQEVLQLQQEEQDFLKGLSVTYGGSGTLNIAEMTFTRN